MIRVDCGYCAESVRIDPVHAKTQLKWKGLFGFGQHVSDPRAFVMRWLTACHGWMYTGGRMGKSTITMTCRRCRAKLPGFQWTPRTKRNDRRR